MSLMSCGTVSGDSTSIYSGVSLEEIYQAGVKSGVIPDGMTYEDWLKMITGNDGADGAVPEIGENGNWWINGGDTGIKASGEDGDKGDPGVDGKDGTSLSSGHGSPNNDNGNDGDSYIDLDTWDFYLKAN